MSCFELFGHCLKGLDVTPPSNQSFGNLCGDQNAPEEVGAAKNLHPDHQI